MKIINIKNEDLKVICSVELEDSEWSELIAKEKEKAAKNVKVPGFRKGKVPLNEAIKHVDMTSILTKSANKAIHETVQKLEKNPELEKIQSDVYPVPNVEISNKFDEKSLSFDVTYWKMPKVTIDDYKKLKVDIKKVIISDEQVQQEIDQLLAREKMLTKKENGTIEKGDQANFDFTGYVDGKEFPGGKAEKFDLEIGSGQFIPGFEDQMIGLKEGDEKEISVKFPKDYHAKDMAGKDAIFKIKIHEVSKVSKPELNEELIKNLNLPDKNIKTPNDLKKFLKENMQKYYEQQAYETNIPLINKAIYDHAKYNEIPQIMIDDEAKEIRHQLDSRLAQMGIKFNDFLKMTNKDEKIINDELLVQAKQNCVVYGALDDIIKKEKLTVSDKDVEERLSMIAKGYNKDLEEIKKIVNVDTLKESLLHEEALLKLIEWNAK